MEHHAGGRIPGVISAFPNNRADHDISSFSDNEAFSDLDTGTNRRLRQLVGRSIVGQSGPGSVAHAAHDDDGRIARTGTVWSASAHIITSVIGSGVLSLAWATAQLGWVAGPLVLFAFGGVTYYTSLMLSDTYRAPGPAHGKRNPTYAQSVEAFLGPSHKFVCGTLQYVYLFGVCVGYIITSAHSLLAMGQAICYHKHGHSFGGCPHKLQIYMAGFGLAEIIFSQIPGFDQLWWLSLVAAIMSISYSGIGLGLGIAKIAENGMIKGSISGVPIGSSRSLGEYNKSKKIFQMFNALGDMAFAYNFSTVLNNIQDTLKYPPAEYKVMHKATFISTVITTFFYILVGSAGYAAFGNSAPGDLMTDFGFYEPAWLVLIANLCIVVHLVGAYQVFAQPLFSLIEGWMISKSPNSTFISSEYRFRVKGVGAIRISPMRISFRTVFVCLTTILALSIPFFNSITGLMGALGFWPMTIYFPIAMHIKQTKLPSWSAKWWWLQAISMISLLVSTVAIVGSLDGIINNSKNYNPF